MEKFGGDDADYKSVLISTAIPDSKITTRDKNKKAVVKKLVSIWRVVREKVSTSLSH